MTKFDTINILNEGNRNLPYFTQEELFIVAKEGRYRGLTPWQRWHGATLRSDHNQCRIWDGRDNVTLDTDFYITCREDTRTNEQWPNGKHINPMRMAWLLYHGEIPGCIDAVHNNADIRNHCETADLPKDAHGCRVMCLNPQHLHVQRTQHWNADREIWEVYG